MVLKFFKPVIVSRINGNDGFALNNYIGVLGLYIIIIPYKPFELKFLLLKKQTSIFDTLESGFRCTLPL